MNIQKKDFKLLLTEASIIQELSSIVNQTGKYPSHTYLERIGYGQLSRAIRKTKGTTYYRKIFGHELKSKPSEYWTKRKTIKAIRDLVKKIKHFPTQEDLKRLNMQGLMGAINKHGGFNEFRRILEVALLKNPNHYWTEPKIFKEVSVLEKEHGRILNSIELHTIGRGDLYHAIMNRGGFGWLYKKINKSPKGHYKANDGQLYPSCLECYVANYFLKNGISYKTHPLISESRKFRADFKVGPYWIEVLGYQNDKTHSDYHARFREKKRLYKKLGFKIITCELGMFLNKRESAIETTLKKRFKCLKKYQSNKPCKLNSTTASIMPPYWWTDIKNSSPILKPIIIELGRFPKDSELRERNLSSLCGALDRFPGGRQKVAELLNCKTATKPKKYWTDGIDGTIVLELKRLMKLLKHFPTQKEIQEHSTVATYIIRHGGTNKFKRLLGVKILQKDKGYWTKKNTIKEAWDICNNLGYYPPTNKLRSINPTLPGMICKYGGTKLFRKLLGYQKGVIAKAERPILV